MEVSGLKQKWRMLKTLVVKVRASHLANGTLTKLLGRKHNWFGWAPSLAHRRYVSNAPELIRRRERRKAGLHGKEIAEAELY